MGEPIGASPEGQPEIGVAVNVGGAAMAPRATIIAAGIPKRRMIEPEKKRKGTSAAGPVAQKRLTVDSPRAS